LNFSISSGIVNVLEASRAASIVSLAIETVRPDLPPLPLNSKSSFEILLSLYNFPRSVSSGMA
tara:strand:+ start:52 stop:240 length:189 start_codon:yes stop_codon:yes gene_type:complete